MIYQPYTVVSLFLLIFTLVLQIPTAYSEEAKEPSSIPNTTNFSEISKLIQKENKPLLLEFKADYCNFCKRLENEQLLPLAQNREWQDKVIMRSFDIETVGKVKDFDGKAISSSEFQQRYEAHFTPYVVFLDSTGREIGNSLEGYNSPDYYGAYLEQSIEQAKHNLAILTKKPQD